MLDAMVTKGKLSQYPLPLGAISRAGDTSKGNNWWDMPIIDGIGAVLILGPHYDLRYKSRYRYGLWIASMWYRLGLNPRSLRPELVNLGAIHCMPGKLCCAKKYKPKFWMMWTPKAQPVRCSFLRRDLSWYPLGLLGGGPWGVNWGNKKREGLCVHKSPKMAVWAQSLTIFPGEKQPWVHHDRDISWSQDCFLGGMGQL